MQTTKTVVQMRSIKVGSHRARGRRGFNPTPLSHSVRSLAQIHPFSRKARWFTWQSGWHGWQDDKGLARPGKITPSGACTHLGERRPLGCLFPKRHVDHRRTRQKSRLTLNRRIHVSDDASHAHTSMSSPPLAKIEPSDDAANASTAPEWPTLPLGCSSLPVSSGPQGSSSTSFSCRVSDHFTIEPSLEPQNLREEYRIVVRRCQRRAWRCHGAREAHEGHAVLTSGCHRPTAPRM